MHQFYYGSYSVCCEPLCDILAGNLNLKFGCERASLSLSCFYHGHLKSYEVAFQCYLSKKVEVAKKPIVKTTQKPTLWAVHVMDRGAKRA